jgi:hypothetical protein
LLALTRPKVIDTSPRRIRQRVVASPAFVASLVDAIETLREIMTASAQVSRPGIRREGSLN